MSYTKREKEKGEKSQINNIKNKMGYNNRL